MKAFAKTRAHPAVHARLQAVARDNVAMRNIWSRNVVGGVALIVISAISLTLSGLGPARQALASAVLSPAAASLARNAPRPDTADVRACGSLPRFAPDTAAQIMAGRLTISP